MVTESSSGRLAKSPRTRKTLHEWERSGDKRGDSPPVCRCKTSTKDEPVPSDYTRDEEPREDLESRSKEGRCHQDRDTLDSPPTRRETEA